MRFGKKRFLLSLGAILLFGCSGTVSPDEKVWQYLDGKRPLLETMSPKHEHRFIAAFRQIARASSKSGRKIEEKELKEMFEHQTSELHGLINKTKTRHVAWLAEKKQMIYCVWNSARQRATIAYRNDPDQKDFELSDMECTDFGNIEVAFRSLVIFPHKDAEPFVSQVLTVELEGELFGFVNPRRNGGQTSIFQEIDVGHNLEALAKAAVSTFEETGHDFGLNLEYPEGWKPCASGSHTAYQPKAEDSKHPLYSILFRGVSGFGQDRRSYPLDYSYQIITKGTGNDAIFTARALGDLNCDGAFSTFEISAKVTNSQVRRSPGIYEVREKGLQSKANSQLSACYRAVFKSKKRIENKKSDLLCYTDESLDDCMTRVCGRKDVKLERSVEHKFEVAESALTSSDITAFKITSKSMRQQSTQIDTKKTTQTSAANSSNRLKNNKKEGFEPGADLSADAVNSQPKSLSVAERIEQIERVEVEVENRLEQWTLAQRANDFDVYARFYAESGFLGLKRTKKGIHKRFTRKTWLQDRASMFKVGLTVYLRDYRLMSSSADSAVITATQYWQSSSGKYADQGPKEFHLKRRAGRWVITREEMISSKKWDGVVPN